MYVGICCYASTGSNSTKLPTVEPFEIGHNQQETILWFVGQHKDVMKVSRPGVSHGSRCQILIPGPVPTGSHLAAAAAGVPGTGGGIPAACPYPPLGWPCLQTGLAHWTHSSHADPGGGDPPAGGSPPGCYRCIQTGCLNTSRCMLAK